MRRIFIIAFIFCFFPFYAEAAKPILNIVDRQVPVQPDGSRLSAADVRAAIIAGCGAKGWAPTIVNDEKIKATISVRGRHHAEVEIPFSETSYSIIYVASDNLDYNEKKQKIHRNYNKWVVNLSASIDNKIRVAAPAARSRAATNSGVHFQLALLGDLRDRGILTEEEFEAEKMRILTDR